MAVFLARGFDPIDNEPLGRVELWKPNDNNSVRSIGLFAEGGTLNQAFYLNSLSDKPFSIAVTHLFQEEINQYGTNILMYCSPQNPYSTPLGDPRQRFYLLSPSSSNRIQTLQTDQNGDSVLVTHLTLEEYLTDTTNAINTYHVDGESVGNVPYDNFLQSFKTVLNVGTQDSGGNITYSNLYYTDPNDSTKRHKFDVLVFAELPVNNLNTISTFYPIGLSADNIETT